MDVIKLIVSICAMVVTALTISGCIIWLVQKLKVINAAKRQLKAKKKQEEMKKIYDDLKKIFEKKGE